MQISNPTLSRVLTLLLATGLAIVAPSSLAQGGRGPAMPTPRAPSLGGANAKLFGDNTAFTADLQMQDSSTARPVTGKISFSDGKSRFELDMIKAAGEGLRDQDAASIKTMGMDTLVVINRPDQKVTKMLYPGLNAYVETALPAVQSESPSKFKSESTPLGKETVDGHPCVKNKVVVTDDKGTKAESTVWNASDLKNFPLKIEQTEASGKVTLTFNNLKLAKPADSNFETPANARKYSDYNSLIQVEVMQRMMRGAGAGARGGLTPPGR